MKYAYPLLYLAISIGCFVTAIVLLEKKVDKNLKTKEACESAPITSTECRVWNSDKCFKVDLEGNTCTLKASTPVRILVVVSLVFFVMACFKAYMVYSGK
jgi:hypothetical protein